MAIKIYIKKADGKEYLWQWDKDRKIGLYDVEPSTEVHFAFCGDQTAIVVLSYSDGEDVLCDVPNILLQRGGILNVYIYRDNATIELARIRVLARPRPEDYVYTETETLNYRELEQRLTELERGGVVLPAVTESDNGKILTVVDGAWAAGELPLYNGEYSVTPAVTGQTLETAQTYLDADITIKKIPYAETSNNSGGTTVFIGNEV